jgi:hypothetical protein
MKTFLKRLVFFLLPVFILGLVIEFTYRNIPSHWRSKIRAFENVQDEIAVLILGTSHAQSGIDPEHLKLNSFNMAQGYQSLYFDNKITEKHIDNMSNLKYALISIDYHSLYYEHYEPIDIYFHYYYDIDYRDRSFIKEDLSWFLFGLDKSTITTSRIKNWIFNTKEKADNSFWRGHDDSKLPTLNETDLKNKMEHFEKIISKGFSPSIEQDLEKLIKTLIKRNVKPILLTLPVSERFNNNLNKKTTSKNLEKINLLKNKFNLLYINFQNWNLPDRYYYDFDHLNTLGAKTVSDSLGIILKKLDTNKPQQLKIRDILKQAQP